MATIYASSRNALLKKIGLYPSKRILVFFISAVLLTIPMGYAYNSIALILFVLYSLLSAKKKDISFNFPQLLPMLLFGLMVLSLAWSIDSKVTLKALSKEASLLFIPLAFCFNKNLIRMGFNAIMKNYSMGMCLYALYFLGRATARYYTTGNPDVFFYHELSTFEVNAIYLSVLVSIGFFYLLAKSRKRLWHYGAIVLLGGFILLLSSKTVIIINALLIAGYFLLGPVFSGKVKLAAATVFLIVAAIAGYNSKISERLVAEYAPNAEAASGRISIREAWEKETFSPADYFNGTAFRVYQARIFTEMLREDNILFTGYGLNTSLKKIEKKGIEHNVFQGDENNYGYNKLNFHNQYIEAFADLGVFGFLLVLAMVLYNLKYSIKLKDFTHITFAVLMIALFLTESFLWRQRGVVFFTMFYCLFNCLPGGIAKRQP